LLVHPRSSFAGVDFGDNSRADAIIVCEEGGGEVNRIGHGVAVVAGDGESLFKCLGGRIRHGSVIRHGCFYVLSDLKRKDVFVL
jgi:hypothetical protein